MSVSCFFRSGSRLEKNRTMFPRSRRKYGSDREFFAAVTTWGKSMITGPLAPRRMLNSERSP